MNRRTFLKGTIGACAAYTAGRLDTGARADADRNTNVRTVYLISKCHLDLGYTNFQHKILRTYFDEFIPRAIDTSQRLVETGKPERYCWTLASWMVQQYLNQATGGALKRFENAIGEGSIAWHALPFTWQSEMLDRSLIQSSLGISKGLDLRFGKKTTAGKLTDVPGHSRGLIGPLAASGVSFLHIGPNGACRCPAFPAPFFRWRNPEGQELVVMYSTDYGSTEQLPGSPIAVSINVRADNTGPHTLTEISDHYVWLKGRYPNAQIIATDLSTAGRALQPYVSSLPVVTQEFGDSWIYGVASDPRKVAHSRELCRLRREWMDSGKLPSGSPLDVAMTSQLILAPEHNWGLSLHQYFPWNDIYTPTELRDASNRVGFQQMQDSWTEKRDLAESALLVLPPALKSEAEQRLRALAPTLPSASGLKAWDGEDVIETSHIILKLDPTTGAIVGLTNRASGRAWAAPEKQMASFHYQTFNKQDFDRFTGAYLRVHSDDFDKPGLENYNQPSMLWPMRVRAMWRGRRGAKTRILIELAPPENYLNPTALLGLPKKVTVEMVIPDDRPEIQIICQCFDKAPSRLPEAMWMSFNPTTSDVRGWTLEKVGQPVSPLDVIADSNRHLHAVSCKVLYKDASGQMLLETLDAPLVSVGDRSLLKFGNEQPDMNGGVHFNLHNNLWGTAFPQWYGEDMRFRFTVSV